MAISDFQFSKTWRDRNAFPTYQDDETQVREDMQVLHDELAAYVNTQLLPVVNDTAAAVEDLVEGSVPDASISTDKIQDGAVTADKLDPSILSGLSIAWEDVSSAITLTPSGSDDVEVLNKKYYYSHALGVVVFFLDGYMTAQAGESVGICQDGYPPASLPISICAVWSASPTVAAALRSGTYSGNHDLYIQIATSEAVSRKKANVSGWYFCNGSGEES